MNIPWTQIIIIMAAIPLMQAHGKKRLQRPLQRPLQTTFPCMSLTAYSLQPTAHRVDEEEEEENKKVCRLSFYHQRFYLTGTSHHPSYPRCFISFFFYCFFFLLIVFYLKLLFSFPTASATRTITTTTFPAATTTTYACSLLLPYSVV